MGIISPATVAEKATRALSLVAVYCAMNIDSPVNIDLIRPFPIPPLVEVVISIPSVIQAIPPDCVYIPSPLLRMTSTAGMVSPISLYCIYISSSLIRTDTSHIVCMSQSYALYDTAQCIICQEKNAKICCFTG